jgi:alkylation response protein AidB-like acyl-CoA dehydrogenase
MDFSFTHDQKLIRDAAHEFLEKECPSDLVRKMEEDDIGYPQGLWRKMAELGWLGLIFPNKYGGSDGTYLELNILLEEMGKYLAPVPFLPTIVLGGLSILYAGTEEQKNNFLPRIAKGELILTMASTEASLDYDATGINVRAIRKGNVFLINGTKLFVPYAHVADYVVCVTRTEEVAGKDEQITLFVVEGKCRGLGYTGLRTVACDRQYEVAFKDVKIPEKNMLGKCGEGWETAKKVLECAAVAQCALMVGGAERVLETAVDYAKKRVQFGHAIGSFQAIQHRIANSMVDLDGAKFATYKAVWKLDQGLPCSQEVSIAKAWVNQACQRICANAHQVIGGVGVINDHDMQLYSRRAKLAEYLWGDTNYHREKVAKHLEEFLLSHKSIGPGIAWKPQ